MAKKKSSWWTLDISVQVKTKDSSEDKDFNGYRNIRVLTFNLFIPDEANPIQAYHQRIFYHPDNHKYNWLNALLRSYEMFGATYSVLDEINLSLIKLENGGQETGYAKEDLKEFEKILFCFYYAKWGTGIGL